MDARMQRQIEKISGTETGGKKIINSESEVDIAMKRMQK